MFGRWLRFVLVPWVFPRSLHDGRGVRCRGLGRWLASRHRHRLRRAWSAGLDRVHAPTNHTRGCARACHRRRNRSRALDIRGRRGLHRPSDGANHIRRLTLGSGRRLRLALLRTSAVSSGGRWLGGLRCGHYRSRTVALNDAGRPLRSTGTRHRPRLIPTGTCRHRRSGALRLHRLRCWLGGGRRRLRVIFNGRAGEPLRSTRTRYWPRLYSTGTGRHGRPWSHRLHWLRRGLSRSRRGLGASVIGLAGELLRSARTQYWPRLYTTGTRRHGRSGPHWLHWLSGRLRRRRRRARHVGAQLRFGLRIERAARRLGQGSLASFKRHGASRRSHMRHYRSRGHHTTRRKRRGRTCSCS
jgi:hypothetical protein